MSKSSQRGFVRERVFFRTFCQPCEKSASPRGTIGNFPQLKSVRDKSGDREDVNFPQNLLDEMMPMIMFSVCPVSTVNESLKILFHIHQQLDTFLRDPCLEKPNSDFTKTPILRDFLGPFSSYHLLGQQRTTRTSSNSHVLLQFFLEVHGRSHH